MDRRPRPPEPFNQRPALAGLGEAPDDAAARPAAAAPHLISRFRATT
ncbi:hypothetical protein [Streptomyces synnematoformans]